MSNTFELNVFVHSRFREIFGKPHRSEGQGEQWTLKPPATSGSTIHVFLNGTPAGPGVWIFDPNQPGDSVLNVPITKKAQVDEVISQIHDRVQRGFQRQEHTGA